MSVESFLRQIQDDNVSAFLGAERVKTFERFALEFYQNPYLHLRCAPQYLLEMLEYYGTRGSTRVGQEAFRFKVYDGPPDRGAEFLVGQERAQADLYGYIKSFARKGRADKMILLHGPNEIGRASCRERV